MVAWGIVMTLMCLCDNYHDLIMYVLLSFTLGSRSHPPSARIFLGLTEAGLFPGVSAL